MLLLDNRNMLKDIILKEVFCRKENQEYQSPDWIFDFRKVSLTSTFLEKYSESFFRILKEKFPGQKKFQVCGLESSSISLLSAIVLSAPKYSFEINGFFIRKGRKKSDSHKIIEGNPNQNPIIIIDDVLNSGKSIVQQVEILKQEKLNIIAVFCILRFRDRDFYKFITEKDTEQNVEIINLFELNDFKKDLNLENIKDDEFSQMKPLKYEIIWKTKKANKPYLKDVLQKSHTLMDGDKIYYTTDDGIFYCADKNTGETIWYKKIMFGDNGKFIFSSPKIFENKIFFGAYDGNFYCLDKNTGDEIWTYKLADWIGSSPAISINYNLVFIGLEFGLWKKRGGIVALDSKSGKEIWKDTHTGLTHSSPFINKKENLVFIGSNDGFLRIYNPKTGEKLKEIHCGKEIKMSFSENKNQTKISYGDFSGKIYILDQKTLEIDDFFQTKEAIYSTPVWVNNFIIFTSLDKRVYKYNSVKKEIEWEFKTGGRIFFNPDYKNNFIWVGSNDGKLYKINFETGKCEGYIQFSERIINNIIFDKKYTYVTTFLNEIYCITI